MKLSEQQEDTILGLLGELTWEFENEFDWGEKSIISDQINSCCVLLGIEESSQNYIGTLRQFINKKNDE